MTGKGNGGSRPARLASGGASKTQLYLFVEGVLGHLEIIHKRRKARIGFSINSAEMRAKHVRITYSCNIKISGKK